MRFATIVHHHPEGWFQSLGRTFAEHDDVVPVALHSSRLLDDGTAILLYELKGDTDAVRTILVNSEVTTDYRVTQRRDCTIAYVHFEPTTTVKRLLRAPAAYGLVVDGPVMLHENGGLELTLIGPEEAIQAALAETPEPLTTSVKRVGRYAPGAQRSIAKLSERQQEVLKTAYDLGYYQQPRRATYEDIATELDCTPANVGDILRRIENDLIEEIVHTGVDVDTEHGAPPSPPAR